VLFSSIIISQEEKNVLKMRFALIIANEMNGKRKIPEGVI